jgi:hypothetical protein
MRDKSYYVKSVLELGNARRNVWRVFGHLKRNLGLRTQELRGLSGATEEFTMAAAAYNLKLLARQVAQG